MSLPLHVFFGFVCHPFVMLAAVLTQLGWSMWMYEADVGKVPWMLHVPIGLVALSALVALFYSQCRKRACVRYHPAWSLFGGSIFQGQLALGMPWMKQLFCGAALGVLIALIDESEVLARVFLSSTLLDELRREHGPRGAVPHVAHAHDTLLIIFILHGWMWTLLTAMALGVWSNAAKLHKTQTVIQVD
jgi:hypothetical protein